MTEKTDFTDPKLQLKYFEGTRDFLEALKNLRGSSTIRDLLQKYPKGLNYQEYVSSGRISDFEDLVLFTKVVAVVQLQASR